MRPAAHELRPGGALGDPHAAGRELATIAASLPDWLLSRAWHDPRVLDPGATARLQAAVVVVRGAAALVGPLGALIETAEAYGGSVTHLDAAELTVLFPADRGGPPTRPHPAGPAGLLRAAVRRACAGALALRQAASPAPGAGPALGIGISAGPVLTGVVGAPATGLVFVVAGRARDQAAAAAHGAAPGSIHLDADLAPVVGGLFSCTPGADGTVCLAAFDEAAFLAQGTPPFGRRVALDWGVLPEATAVTLLGQLRAFLPPGACAGAGEEARTAPGDAARALPALAIHFAGPDWDGDPQALAWLGDYCYAVQTAVAPFGGRLHRVHPGTPDSTLEVLFDAAPLAGQGPAEAIRAADAVAANCRSAAIHDVRLVIATRQILAEPPAAGRRWAYWVREAGDAAKVSGIGSEESGIRNQESEDLAQTSNLKLQNSKIGPRISWWPILLPGDRPRTPLVGRAAEWETLRRAAEAALSGRGRVVRVSGPAGSGKSRLIAEFLDCWAEKPGRYTYAGGCLEPAPYEPWIAILRALFDLRPGLTAAQQHERLRGRSQALAPAFAETVPWLEWLLGLPPAEPGARLAPPAIPAARLGDLVLALIVAQARRRPTLLALDDTHHADPASAHLIETLARQTAGLPLLLVLGSETSSAAPSGAHDIAVALSPLPLDARLALIRAQDPNFSAGAALAAQPDGGNPGFLGAMVAADRADRSTLAAAMRGRVTLLPAPARQVLEHAAVLGAIPNGSVLRGILPSAVGDAALAEHLCALHDAGLLHRAAGTPEVAYRFGHDLVRQAAYDGLPLAERARLHRRAAALLERGPAPDHPLIAYQIAAHYRQAGGPEAILWLHRAGDAAAALFVPDMGAACYREALDCLEAGAAAPALAGAPGEIWRKLAGIQQGTGDYPGAEASLRQALRYLPPGTGAERAQIYCAISQVREARGDYPGALAATRLGDAEIASTPPGLTWARLRLQAGGVLFRHGRYQEALAALAAAQPVLEATGAVADLGTAHKILGNVYHFTGDHARAREHYTRSLELRRRLDDRGGSGQVLNNLGNIAWSLGDFAEARGYYQQYLEIMQHLGHPGGTATALVNLGSVALYQGELAAALDYNDRSLQAARQIDRVEGIALAYNGRGETLEALGRLDEAAAAHRQARDLGEEIANGYIAGRAALGLARCALAAGDPAGSRAALEHCAPHVGATPEIETGYYLGWGRLALAGGQVFEAEVALERAYQVAADHGYRLLLVPARRLLGELALARTRLAPAMAHLEAARALALEIGARLEHAHVLLALARLHAQQAPPAPQEARSLLTQARDEFVACGAPPPVLSAEYWAAGGRQ